MEKLRFSFKNRLTTKEIVEIVDNYKRDVVPEVNQKNEYARGNNPHILSRRLPKTAPQNKIPIPYGRRIISIITSYMYLPGLITYGAEEAKKAYFDSIKEIFDYNKEPLETYKIGWQTSVHGVGYEIFYNVGTEEESTIIDKRPGYLSTMPRFEKVPVAETIPIYDFEIVPNIQAFIRFYTIEAEETEYIHVYYPDVKIEYQRKKNAKGLAQTPEQEHGYAAPPIVVYENNEDIMGDFDAVQTSIDAYDVLMSDSLNEFDRFAQAYLVAKGFTITNDQVEKLKYNRIFSGLNKEDEIAFLTKPIETDFIKFLSEQFRAEIHRGAGIPNIDDYKWGGDASGETIGKFIYLMELFTGVKEAYFRQGLQQRIQLLTDYWNLDGSPEDIDINMSRNDPDKSELQADLLEKYSGHVSERTLLETFADFVDDVDAEMEQMKKEKQSIFKVDLDTVPPEDETQTIGSTEANQTQGENK